MADTDPLETQIRDARLTISSDGYPMSIGELTNLYRDGELRIRPEFQRFFRWTSMQKTHLIESILLGIPLPSIFVAQSESGAWELVDGLQRVSTILQFQGELRDADTMQLSPPLKLEATKYLPALQGRYWYNEKSRESLSEAQRLDIKRAKLDIKIIKRESSPQARFDLFHRLNNYGSPLNAAEMRSALLVSISPDFFAWMERLSRQACFTECVQLSEKLVEERFDLELLARFLVLHNRPFESITQTSLRDLPQVLDDEMTSLAIKFPVGADALENTFLKTFEVVASNGGDKIFRRWDVKKGEFQGSFLLTAFEVIACGIGHHIANNEDFRTDLVALVKEFWSLPQMETGYSTGRSTEARLVENLPLGRQLTSPR
jgi:uncharacterized protein DUF262